MNRHTKLRIAREFAEWAGIHPDVVEQWGHSFTECDVMFAYGHGHQSMSQCEDTGKHVVHIYENMTAEDHEVSQQTYTRKKDGKVFRLCFNNRGWY